VHAAARSQEGQELSTLDYIYTGEKHLIGHISICSPLGKSDHGVLQWDTLLKVQEVDSKAIKQNFWKVNYDKITKKLLAINWTDQYVGKTVEEMWTEFESELLRHIEENMLLKRNIEQRRKTTFLWQL